LKDKLFYVFTDVEELGLAKNFSATIYATALEKKRKALTEISNGGESKKNIPLLMFDEAEIAGLKEALKTTFHEDGKFGNLVGEHLIPSGYYKIDHTADESEMFISAFESALRGVNLILERYGLGAPGKYAYIDSVGFDVNSLEYGKMLQDEAHKILLKKSDQSAFYMPSMDMALALLHLNERTDAARFEPMQADVNRAAVQAIPSIDWSKFQYAVILVPGNGPKGSERLSENAKVRLRAAVGNYRRKLAPFIMVSGGSVHPFKTKINEAEEMKRELMEQYGIPESAIIMEPHARHTTTNLRNCNRLIFRYGFPRGKKVLITTDKKQAAKISDKEFIERSQIEIKHVPFIRLVRTSDIDIEYFPVLPSLPVDLEDPLDP
jgi:hypothetical protein